MNKKIQAIFFVLGMLLLIILFRHFGVSKTIEHILRLKWNFVIIVSIHLISNTGLAFALRLFIHQKLTLREFFVLVEARIAGDAVSAINSIGSIAGEPIKAVYMKDLVPLRSGLAAVVMDRTVHSIAVIFIFLTGIVIGFFILDIPLYISFLSLGWLIILLMLLSLVLYKQQKGFLSFIVHRIPRVLQEKFMTEERWKSLREIDDEISRLLLKENRKSFLLCFILHYVIVLLINTTEIFLIITFIETVSSFNYFHAMFIYIFTFILSSTMFFVPADLGTSEGSFSLALAMLGYDPALGLSLGVIRRFRRFAWAGIGVPFLFYAGLIKTKNEPKRSKERDFPG